MKNYFIYFFLFCILTSILYIKPSFASGPLSGNTIVIDPGHGGIG